MRSTLIYLLLVGAPLLGLLAILTAGEQLVPPPAIGGSWLLQSSTSSACVLQMRGDGTAGMNISQSGPNGEASFADNSGVHLSVTLAGDSITGTGAATAQEGCPGETLSLNGRLRISDSTTVITGTLSRTGCASCNPMDFTARRLPPTVR